MIKAGIIGGSGYTGGELIRLLLHHPETEIDFAYSRTYSGRPVAEIHQDLAGTADLMFTDEVNPEVDVLFLCMGHGNSAPFLKEHPIPDEIKIVDLSRDFRLQDDNAHPETGKPFIYGLPEIHKSEIESAQLVANPGCFATTVQLALLPLADAGYLNDDIHIHAVTGATGAGKKLRDTTHFSWRSDNVSIYKPFTHQHLDEIRQSVTLLHPGFDQAVNFIPIRGNFTRGIFCSAYLSTDEDIGRIQQKYRDFYSDAAFTHVVEQPLHLKQVVNTNNCLVHVEKHDGKVLVTSIIDNLLKGASGQAVHNMNLQFGLPEKTGLQLKAAYF